MPNGFMDFNAALIKSLKADGYEKVLVQEAATPEEAARIKADVQRDMRNYHLTWAPERRRGRVGIWARKIYHNIPLQAKKESRTSRAQKRAAIEAGYRLATPVGRSAIRQEHPRLAKSLVELYGNPACRHPVRDMNYAIKGGAEKAYVYGKCGRCGKLFGPEGARLRGNPASKGQVDETGLRELRLFIENDPALARRFAAIAKNLNLKIKRGNYDADKASRLWLYLVDEGAKKYAREFASPAEWSNIFNAATRRELASQMARVYSGKMANPYSRNARKRIYVGQRSGKRTIFLSEHIPTEASHGHLYSAVIGPFKTRKAAELMVEAHGPQIQSVADAERAASIIGRGDNSVANPYSRRARFKHVRLRPPAYFDPRSFRTISVKGTGAEITVGCPKGHYDAGRGVCRVGMKAQRILKPK